MQFGRNIRLTIEDLKRGVMQLGCQKLHLAFSILTLNATVFEADEKYVIPY